MEYIFGKKGKDEILKTKGESHTDLAGWQEYKISYPDCEITDDFYIEEKYDSKEDVEGNCYDWYIISSHNRNIDRTNLLKEEIEAITPYTLTKTAYIGDTEITFYDTPENGNVTVFFNKTYTMERVADRIMLTFEPLEEITKITISIV